MKTFKICFAALLTCGTLGGCVNSYGNGERSADVAANQEMISVTGSIAYRERIALLPGSTAIVSLNDVSLADAPSKLIGQQRIDLTGEQVPIAFQLEFPASDLDKRHRYSVRGVINGPDGALMWTTDTAHLIDVNSPSQNLGRLGLVRASSGDVSALLQPGKEWVVENIDNTGVIDNSRITLTFLEDGNLSGRSGCNNFMGAYFLEDGELRISDQMAATLMLCPPALMEQEASFLAAIQSGLKVSQTDTGALRLYNASGRSILAR